MTSFNQSENIRSSGNSYENAMKSILKKRTGKVFQHNLEAAPVPKQEIKLSHEEVADQIFDNIIRRNLEKAQSVGKKTAPQIEVDEIEQTSVQAESAEVSNLDALLWPDEVTISDKAIENRANSQVSGPVYDSPSEHLDALAQQYAAEMDHILGFE